MNSSSILLRGLFIVLLCCFVIVDSACPYSDASLTAWSSVNRLKVPDTALRIEANERILLDANPGFVIKSLEIYGELVIGNAALNLDAQWIKVMDGGKFTAGSSDCKLSKKFIVTLFGTRVEDNPIPNDAFDNVAFGSKGFIVAVGGSLQLYGANSGPAWVRLAQTALRGTDTLNLQEAVGWKAGDLIVIASTDFGEVLQGFNNSYASLSWARGLDFPDQSENVTIKSVSGGGKVITLNLPLNYTHWGTGVESAEVGLLTYNIVVQGDEGSDDIEFGGHLMMRKGPVLHIEGVEFNRMGQRGNLGRYPVHYHMQHEVWDMGYSFLHSSIYNTYQRSIVIHESHGIFMQDIVGYRTIGHMFFLEDGGERMNTWDRVLGISARGVASEEWKYGKKIQIVPTDSSPSIFWITNMNNTVTNCVAVGGRFGFWHLMPKNVTGPSIPFYNNYNPRIQAVNTYSNNVAHSCVDTGFEWDNYLTATLTTEEASYGTRPVFRNLVAYKCRQFGFWGKSSFEFINIISMDNRRGMMTNGATLVHDSLFVGESDNLGVPMRPTHTRGFPDLGGGNASKICGHESYDNGGPQYSYNNVFVNFVTSSSRKAGALCPLQTGPFMLDTENRYFNLTFINANRVHVGSPRTGDNEWGWTVLDVDGSITDVAGGAWIVSQNVSHLLKPNCVHKPEWEAYACPPFREGYVQLLVTNQLEQSASNWAINGTNVQPPSSVASSTRVTRAVFYDMDDSSRFGKTVGARIDCANGTEDACFQYMHNVMPRKFYTIRFVVNDVFVQTPALLSVNMHSAYPGDYLFVAIPYPADALPFNVTYGTIICSRVTDINALNATTYYYDSNTEHLYLRTKNTATATSYSQRGSLSLTDYNSATSNHMIRTSCNPCNPSQKNLEAIPKPPTLSLVEDYYFAKLQGCQVVGGNSISTGVGSAYFWFYPETQELHYNIYHDLTATATSVVMGKGGIGSSDYVIATRNFRTTTSPVRGVFTTISSQQWADLAKGNIYVQVSSSAYPAGHIRGQLQCEGKCSIPNPVANVNPCVATGNSLPIWEDFLVSGTFTDSAINDNTTRTADPVTKLCGNSSLSINIKSGVYYVSPRTPFLITASNYKFIEFYVKLQPGYGELPLYVQVLFNNTNYPIPRVRLPSTYISNNVIDEYSGWSRVLIPFSFFNVPVVEYNITRITFGLQDTGSREAFNIDNFRLVQGGDEPTKAVMAASEVKTYDPAVDICNAPATTGSTGGESSTTNGAGNSGNGQNNDNAGHVLSFSFVLVVILAVFAF